MCYSTGNQTRLTFDQIIDQANDNHLSRLTCSMVPTYDYWRFLGNKILSQLMKVPCNICFEYPVDSLPGCPASYTDVMLIAPETAVAVESKWTENVSYHCHKHTSSQRIQLMEHWLRLIQPYTSKNLHVSDIDDIEYQLLHRTASACSLNKPNCIVLYQIFYIESITSAFHAEISKLKNLLAPSNIRFFIDEVKIKPNILYNGLSASIAQLSDNEKAFKIKNVLKSHGLFDILNENIYEL